MSASATIQSHNEKPAAVWSSGGAEYDRVSRGIADSIEHCVLRLDPRPGERILDLATGTGWTSRAVAKRGARVIGADIAADLVAAARERAKAEGLDIDYRIGDAEKLPFADGEFDAVIDFDAVTRDPAHPTRFLPAYDSGDHLHPGDAGYRAMAHAIDTAALLRTH